MYKANKKKYVTKVTQYASEAIEKPRHALYIGVTTNRKLNCFYLK